MLRTSGTATIGQGFDRLTAPSISADFAVLEKSVGSGKPKFSLQSRPEICGHCVTIRTSFALHVADFELMTTDASDGDLSARTYLD